MNKKDAFSILNIKRGYTCPADTEKDYHTSLARYYQSNNPASNYMLQLITDAYETLKDYEGAVDSSTGYYCYSEKINKALNAIINLNLTIEICGSWVWVGGDTTKHSAALLEAGFNLAHKKRLWYYRPEQPDYRYNLPWTMEQIRAKYGSDPVKSEEPLFNADFAIY